MTGSRVLEPFALARRAADELRARSGVDHYDAVVVLGSGWREGAEGLGSVIDVTDTAELPGFVAPTVAGHGAQVISTRLSGATIALVSGRVHLYEGHSPAVVVHPVRALIEAGARRVVLTNACGSLDPAIAAGSVAAISDHVNLTASSPLEGPPPPEGYESRFVDLTDLYDRAARERVRAVVPDLAEGVYAGLRGPHYETPAEIAMLRTMGASFVGMSTVLEAIAARHLGAAVLGLTLVSNLAAGVASGPLDHGEVLAAGRDASERLGEVLAAALSVL